MHSFYKMIYLIHTLELDYTSHSGIQDARLTQAAIVYGTFSGLQLQSITYLS